MYVLFSTLDCQRISLGKIESLDDMGKGDRLALPDKGELLVSTHNPLLHIEYACVTIGKY